LTGTNKKILYIGSLEKESNSRKRFLTLQKMGHLVEGIDIDQYIFVRFWLRFHYHLFIGPGIQLMNKHVLQKVKEFQPDILWVDNKPYLKSKTLKTIKHLFPEIKLANILTDDPCGRYGYCWMRVYHTFKNYHIQFVQREINIAELKKLGAPRVEICYRSFDPDFHKPIPEIQNNRNNQNTIIGFIGSYEEEREEYLAYLVQQGINIQITGNDWPKGKYWHLLKSHYNGPSVFGEKYVEVINKMDIALHFLRRANRDQQDSRTFEIPACDIFMLAERSPLHLQLFEEGKEVDFFTSKEELLSKVNFYIQNKELRLKMASSAYVRSFQSGYYHQSRLQKVLEKIYTIPLN
jgi:hypothetical protein